jgi:ribonuclease HI
VGKWVYSLVEYDLTHEPLRAMEGKIVADFIVEHMGIDGVGVSLIEVQPWSHFFDRSICSKGQGVSCILVSPSGKNFELAVRLEFPCTNNQVEYEALLYSLEYLREMGVMSIKVYGDSLLVVQQVKGNNQCLGGVLNSYRDKCWDDVIRALDEFCISHIPREKNKRANSLAQQASGYNVVDGMFSIETNPAVQDRRANIDGSAETYRKADHGGLESKSTGSVLGKNVMTAGGAADGNVTDQG